MVTGNLQVLVLSKTGGFELAASKRAIHGSIPNRVGGSMIPRPARPEPPSEGVEGRAENSLEPVW